MKKIFLFYFFVIPVLGLTQQNLGVDQSNPQAKVHITQTGTQPALLIEDQASDVTPVVVDANGKVGIGTSTPSVSLDVNATDAVGMANGTTAQRPVTSSAGDMRFNSDTKSMEFYDGNNWISLTPSGTIQNFGGVSAVAPTGWLLCDGSAVSRTTYANLFAIIGTNFGAGDGTTTFNLPDLRGRFVRGTDLGAGNDPDASGRTASNTGGNIGNAVGSLQSDKIINHQHTLTYETGAGNGNNITTSAGFYNGSGAGISLGTTDNFGGNETRPKNVNLNFIIKY